MIYGLFKGLQWKSIINFSFIHDLIRWKQNCTDNSQDILIVNLRDSMRKLVMGLASNWLPHVLLPSGQLLPSSGPAGMAACLAGVPAGMMAVKRM